MVVKLSRRVAPRAAPVSLPKASDYREDNTPPSPGSGCFSRLLRLLKPEQFKQVFAEGCKVGNQQFTLLARRNGLDHVRIGMAIARKSVRRAVDRNRIKRMWREKVRLNQASLAGWDLVVMARPPAAQMDTKQLTSSITHLLGLLEKRCHGTTPISPIKQNSPR